MAKSKKIQKYVPTMKLPVKDSEWKLLDESSKYNDFYECVNIWNTHARDTRHYNADYYDKYVEKFRSGELDINDWRNVLGSWGRQALFSGIFRYTPEYSNINDPFMKEYGERADLQEVYQEAFNDTYYIYDNAGCHYNRNEAIAKGWDKAPQDYAMYRGVINRSSAAQKKIELARETPYLEGDLVLLRKPFIGRRGVDPLYVNPYSEEARNGAATPDDTVIRVGTVVGVTDRINGYHASKGSKVIQLIWMGVEDSQIIDVEERFIKWHERPTYKNGMKKRPENRE